MNIHPWIWISLVFFSSSALSAEPNAAMVGGQTIVAPVSRASTLMGKKLLVEQDSTTVASGLGVASTTKAQILGHSLTLMEASVEAIPNVETSGSTTTQAISTNAPQGTVLGSTDLYVNGVKLWTGALTYTKGSLAYNGGVAPTEIPFTIFVYPVGPLLLEVSAGVDFEAELDASITPGFSYPITDSTLDAKLAANLGAGGFIEADANLWLLRAGVGGAVDLVDGEIGLAGHILFDGNPPVGEAYGLIHLLSGQVYAFADDRFFFGEWHRFWQYDFYQWNGWCYAFGADTCGT